jgi:hypothetical protein
MSKELFSLAGMAANKGYVESAEIIGALGMMDDPAELESALGQINELAETIDGVNEEDVVDALGALQSLRTALMRPAIRSVTSATQSRSYANAERLRAVVGAGTAVQVADAQRPHVFMFVRFNHAAAGALAVTDLRPSLPGQSTLGNDAGPLHFIQARTFLKSGSFSAAEIDIQVARIPSTQYAAPTGAAVPAGIPIEFWSSQSYNTGLKPPRIRGLERADSNTVISFTSTADAAVNYGMTLEFVMQANLGGNCVRVMPSIIRGPMAVLARRLRLGR